MRFDPDEGRTGFGGQLFRLRWRRLGLGREAFAARYGLTVGALQDAEQNRGEPSRAMKALVAAIEAAPEAVAKAVAAAGFARPEPPAPMHRRKRHAANLDAGIEGALARRMARSQQRQEVPKAAQPTDLKKRWREHLDEREAMFAAWRARGYSYPPPATVPFPDDLRDLTCGAKNRQGGPCRNRDIYRNGRCRFHGGLSTGPKSVEGRAQARSNLGRRWVDRPDRVDGG